jgi:hypothetical protein
MEMKLKELTDVVTAKPVTNCKRAKARK